jgi:hypothetical protein
LTAALTAFGVTTGTVDRVERNHAVLFWIGCFFIFGAIIFAVIGLTLPADERSSDPPPAPLPPKTRLQRLVRFLRARHLFRLGAVAFLLGMCFVLAAIIRQAREQPRPSITAKLATVEGQERFETSIKAGGLKGSEHLRMYVEGILPPHQGPQGKLILGKSTNAPEHFRVPLYFSVLGPDASGDVDYTVQLPLPRRFESIQVRAWVGDTAGNAPEDCFRSVDFKVPTEPPTRSSTDFVTDEKETTKEEKFPGCLTFRVPFRAALPLLAASWKSPRSKKPVVVVSLDAKDVPLTVPDVSKGVTVLARPTLMAIRIYGLAERSTTDVGEELFFSLIGPDREGTITRSFRIAVPRRYRAVCVAAALVDPSDNGEKATARKTTKPKCADVSQPKIKAVSTVWTYLVVP